MEKTLMILTSHRLDCLKIAMDLLLKSDNLDPFDRLVFLLNGVEGAHLRYIQNIIAANPQHNWDTVSGPRGRSECISSLENQCIRRYPNNIYVKMDEDIFVAPGWATRLLDAYEQHRSTPNLALITPLIPNNAYTLYKLLDVFYRNHYDEYTRLFGEEPAPGIHSKLWSHPKPAEWATRLFINLEQTNTEHRSHLASSDLPEFIPFSDPFSIGCICFDYAHWETMGEIPAKDEPEWCKWIQDNNWTNILDCRQIALHYSFFVQQEWLDRTNLLEDIRRSNLPGTQTFAQKLGLVRMHRQIMQIPSVVKRRLGSNS